MALLERVSALVRANLNDLIDKAEEIAKVAIELMHAVRKPGQAVRLIGVGVIPITNVDDAVAAEPRLEEAARTILDRPQAFGAHPVQLPGELRVGREVPRHRAIMHTVRPMAQEHFDRLQATTVRHGGADLHRADDSRAVRGLLQEVHLGP